MHISLYRKYRPKTFSQVIGQKYVVEALKNQIASGKIGHAFIFTGTRGTGKTSCAKIFAKAVNCQYPVNGEPCLECDICKGIENESIYDVVEMDAASNNSVEDIRDILNEVNYLPVMAKYRVYIIDEVHMLSPAAFNALLKTLEEPPAHVIFILATTEIHKVPATILSRCQRYDFTKLTVEEISIALMEIAKKENISLTPKASSMIASLSDGAMRDANSILDTCASMGNVVDEDTVANIVGITKEQDIFEFVDCLARQDSANALKMLMELTSKSIDMKRLCEEIITHLSNLIVANLVDSTADLLNMSNDKFANLKKQGQSCSHAFISYALGKFTNALDSINKGQNPKVAMDIAVYTVCNPQQVQTYTMPVQNLETSKKVHSQSRQEREIELKEADEKLNSKTELDIKENSEIEITKNKTSSNNIVEKSENSTITENDKEKTEEKVEKLPVSNNEEKPVLFEYWQKAVDITADLDLPINALLKESKAYIYKNVIYIKAHEGFNDYIRNNKEVSGIVKSAIYKACGHRYSIGGYKNIESMFNEQNKHDSIDDIRALCEKKDVEFNIKD